MHPFSPKNQIALVGMACRLPGADNLDQYWKVIRDGVSTARPLPESRFDRSLYYDSRKGIRNRSYSDIACLVNEKARGPYFDALPESVRACPEIAYRTLCDVAAEALADASLELRPKHRRSGGVFLGHARSSGLAGDLAYGTCVGKSARYLHDVERFRELELDHEKFVKRVIDEVRREKPHRDAKGGPRLGPHAASALLAETFSINGPYMTFNSACASSLSALNQAILSLKQGKIEMALVGGASVCHYETFVMFSQAQSLSGLMSRPFDDQADGLIVGEGYAVVILKTLDQAIQDNDKIHAVIQGIGVSSDGKGKSLWAPRKEGQIAAIRRAYRHGLGTDNLQYIEAHATSTQLGDATEITALDAALDLPAGSHIPIGSVKANIGHTLETAGLSGLLKVVLCMRHQTIAPAVNLTQLNRKIDWDALPFHVPTQAMPWPQPAVGRARRAAVNAFGIGGLNVHVVLDDYPVPNSARSVSPRSQFLPDNSEQTSASEPIAVVGRGIIVPGAINLKALVKLLVTGADPKGPVANSRLDRDVYLDRTGPRPWHCTSNHGGEVNGFEYDWRRHKIPPKQIQNASPLQFMLLDAVEQAIREAGFDENKLDTENTGVVVGCAFGGEFSTKLLMGIRLPEFQRRLVRLLADEGCDAQLCEAISQQYAETLIKECPAILDETGSFTSSSLASRITKSFNLMGGGVAVDAGNCASSAALDCCVDQLRSRDSDMMICVAGQEDLGATFFERMSLTGMLAPDQPASPFDKGAAGMVPAEGCVALLLMRLSDAQEQGREVRAVIRGIGAATADSQSQACEQAVRSAFDRANDPSEPTQPGDIIRIETTGFATPQMTADEIEGIFHGYAERERKHPISLDCMMTQTGHLGAASALASIVKSSIELEQLEHSANFGLVEPSPLILSSPLFEVANQPAPLRVTNSRGRAVTAIHNADRQTAYHILLERDAKVHAPPKNAMHSETSSYETSDVDGIQVIDATQRRKQSMRDKAMQRSQPTPRPTQRSQETPPTQETARATDSATPTTHPMAPTNATESATKQTEPISEPSPVKQSVSAPAISSPAEIVESHVGMSAMELREFLVNFVVEQTGYPAEFVEMDADLEADLGIDSIKKAQMFGELGEHFAITPDETLTLDDFPTLQHIFDYLESYGVEKTETNAAITVAAKSLAAIEYKPSQTNTVPRTERTDQVTGVTPPAETKSADDSPPPAAQPPAAQPPDIPSREPTTARPVGDELEWRLRDFVCEQTGFPAESLDLDADISADLGLDASRKSQLLEEVAAEFELTLKQPPSGSEPSTLRDVYQLIRSAIRSKAARKQEELIPDYKRLSRTRDLLEMVGLSVPYFAEHESVTQDTTQVKGKETITFCSSNYLGMSGDPVVTAAAQRAIETFGTSVSASRLIAGKPIHRELEEELAKFLGAEATIVFSSGYAANEATIGHLFGPGDLVIHDSLAHNCIIQGAVLSGAQRLNFPHNDWNALDRQLQTIRQNYRRVLIAIEGVYSMDGDFSDLPNFLDIKRRHDTFLLVDDAHAIGTMGATGRGSPEFFGIDPSEIDLWVGTLSKALGSGGGFVAGSRDIVDYLKHSNPGFIYTVALAPSSAGAALAALNLLQTEPERVATLQSNARLLLELAHQHGLDTGPAGNTPVVPIMVDNSHTALLLSRRLLERGIDIQPIVYPAVENDAARLRFMITAKHTEQQIRQTIEALAEDLQAVQAESIPIEQWKSVLTGKSPMPESVNLPSAGEKLSSDPSRVGAEESKPKPDSLSGPATTSALQSVSEAAMPSSETDSVANELVQPQSNATRTLATAGPASTELSNASWTRTELKDYLINFIVEQTGYPPEFVEMDADLEADLGIDSIKKAQLFGELGQQFDIEPDETLTLDDFPTLTHVFGFIADQMRIDD